MQGSSGLKAVIGVLVLTCAASAHATVMVKLSIEDMAKEADAVVRGRVVNNYSAWNEDRRRIYTFTDVELTEKLFGPGEIDEGVTIRTMGGEVGEIGMKVSGTPRFKNGEDVLVFLRKEPGADDRFQVVGMSQGKYRVEPSVDGKLMAVADTEGLAFVRGEGANALKIDPSIEHPGVIDYAALRSRILRAAVEKNGVQTSGPKVPNAPVAPTRPTPPVVPNTSVTP